MRYINKNQITEIIIEDPSGNGGKQWWMGIYLINNEAIELNKDTKEECIALAEKLGLTLID